MGFVYADVRLVNEEDKILAKRNIIGSDEIREVTVKMLADSGSYYLCINEDIKELLGLETKRSQLAQMANGFVEKCDVVGPIEIFYHDRRCTTDALVLKGSTEPLLGAIPMEQLDLMVHPLRQEIIMNPLHGPFAHTALRMRYM